MIIVIDYRMGNLGSILNMLRKIGAPAVISSDPAEIRKADRLILPGVGAFDSGIRNLQDLGLIPVLEERVLGAQTPILGICLGMQLITRSSQEGNLPGLGWIDAATVRFNHNEEYPNLKDLKIPHMGWNTIQPRKESALFRDMFAEPRFYFVHSYHAVCDNEQDILTTTHYGYEFVSAFQRGNIFGVQFHPEKSHKFGMKVLKNFAEFV